MVKCLICERGPAISNGYCHNCGKQLEAGKKQGGTKEPSRFLTYRGSVVGLFEKGGGLVAQLLNRNPERLPKAKTLDLNTYLNGYERSQIKRFKACVLQLSQV